MSIPFLTIVALTTAMASGTPGSPGEAKAGSVVFVCAHGNVKSLIASRWFDRLAAERGLAVRAIARGLTPENPVPPAIAERLHADGFDVAGYEARALTPDDVDRAALVVLIGVDAPPWLEPGRAKLEAWDGVPPASERYDASRDAMRVRLERILEDMRFRKP